MHLAQVLTFAFIISIIMIAARTSWDACARPILKHWAKRNRFSIMTARQQWFSMLTCIVSKCLIKYDVAVRREDGSIMFGTAVVDVNPLGAQEPVQFERKPSLKYWFGW